MSGPYKAIPTRKNVPTDWEITKKYVANKINSKKSVTFACKYSFAAGCSISRPASVDNILPLNIT